MATNGVKIIDSDLAWDTYNSIMDLYDSDAEIHIIRKEVPFVKTDFGIYTDFYYEIFVTTYALAMWEIGEISSEIINEVKRVVEIKAGVKVWTEEMNIKEGKKRQKVLDNLIKKITTPNNKIRKRKKYHVVKNLFFNENDVLIYKLKDNNYYAVICTQIRQKWRECSYYLAFTNFKNSDKPTINDVTKSFIFGHKIKSGYSPELTLEFQTNVNIIWEYVNQNDFVFGLKQVVISHKDFIQIKFCFEQIGQIKLYNSLKKTGSIGFTDSLDYFENFLKHYEENKISYDSLLIPISLITEKH